MNKTSKEKIRGIKILSRERGDKTIRTFPLGEMPNDKERMFVMLSVMPMVLQKETETQIDENKIKIEKTFAFHGFVDEKLLVTIPVSLEELRKLGFIK